MTNPAVCHDKVVNQQLAACSGSPHDDEYSIYMIHNFMSGGVALIPGLCCLKFLVACNTQL